MKTPPATTKQRGWVSMTMGGGGAPPEIVERLPRFASGTADPWVCLWDIRSCTVSVVDFLARVYAKKMYGGWSSRALTSRPWRQAA